MLTVTAPPQVKPFLDYTLSIVFGEWLALEYWVDYKDFDRIEISLDRHSQSIQLNADFLIELGCNEILAFDFSEHQVERLSLKSLELGLEEQSAFKGKNDMSVLFGSPEIKFGPNIKIDFDLLGSIFFMLSRVEELVSPERDLHDRFPAKASLAYKYGFLERPIVDEFVELLWACMSKLWPELQRKERTAKTFVSCDVDTPLDPTVKALTRLLRTCAGDLLKRRSVTEVLKRIRRYHFNKRGDFRFDPNYTFDWYMDVCEQNGLKAAFYFIPESIEPGNGDYSLKDKAIQDLLIKIDKRGHEIGVHGSYQTYLNGTKLKKQKTLLEGALLDLGIEQKIKGNRQHYLRWDSSLTPELLDDAGFEYDTTGGYADHAGFRFGTCHEFSMWSWKKKEKLNLKQRPLVVMECTVIDDRYMGLGNGGAAQAYIENLKQACNSVDGRFALLWHNSSFACDANKNMFAHSLLEG